MYATTTTELVRMVATMITKGHYQIPTYRSFDSIDNLIYAEKDDLEIWEAIWANDNNVNFCLSFLWTSGYSAVARNRADKTV